MKTLEEVNKHLLKVGYTVKTIDRIVSFLIGAGLLEAKDYEIECIEGEKDFQDFLDWYNEEKDLNKEPINEDLNKAIEELEIEAHNALDNIFATLHEGKLEKDEYDALIDSMNALVILGNEYE